LSAFNEKYDPSESYINFATARYTAIAPETLQMPTRSVPFPDFSLGDLSARGIVGSSNLVDIIPDPFNFEDPSTDELQIPDIRSDPFNITASLGLENKYEMHNHGASDLNTVVHDIRSDPFGLKVPLVKKPSKKVPCQFHSSGRRCRYGNACKFEHEGSGYFPSYLG
jgi:hypothetical protein